MLPPSSTLVGLLADGSALSPFLSRIREPYGLIVAGLGAACLALHRFLPRGLGGSLFAFCFTIALGLSAVRGGDDEPEPIMRLSILGAALSSIWALLGSLLIRLRKGDLATGRIQAEGKQAPAGQSNSHIRTTEGTAESILAWAILSAAAAMALLTVQLLQATWPRINMPMISFEAVSPDGLTAFGCLFASLVIWRSLGPSPQQPTVLLTVAILVMWWSSLMIPSVSLTDEIPLSRRYWFQPAWWTWTFQLQIGLTFVLLCGAILQDQAYRRRRRRAWPDRLDHLLMPYSRWPAYLQVEALIAAMVLLLGVYQIIRWGGRGILLPVTSGSSLMAAAAACLFMTYRRWSGNTAGLGLALVTLSVATFSCAATEPFCNPEDFGTYAERMPILFNALLFALAFMIWFWAWLAGVWNQQLLDGTAWTTAGRMIPYATRTAFYVAAIAVLVGFQMTLWQRRALTTGEDNSLARILFGAIALLVLALQSARMTRRRNSPAWAAMSVVFIITALLFIFVRLPASAARGWVEQYEPLVMGMLALPVLLTAEALPNSIWKAFSAPLWFLALLFLPLKALMGLLPGEVLPEAWIRPLTLAILAAVYFVAGGREHRRAFLVLGAVLLLASLSGAYRLYW